MPLPLETKPVDQAAAACLLEHLHGPFDGDERLVVRGDHDLRTEVHGLVGKRDRADIARMRDRNRVAQRL